MKLIGMLDSPYVRRVAVSLQFLGLPFEHEAVSVFRHYDRFMGINPAVKAPTLVCDDGGILMDSTLILDYAERLSGRTLMPAGLPERQRALFLIGMALAAVEKSIQHYYEHELRPEDKRHAPWVERVTGQLHRALRVLDDAAARAPLESSRERIDQAGITLAVVWGFMQGIHPSLVPVADYPAIAAFSAKCESLPEFRRAPHGFGTYPVA